MNMVSNRGAHPNLQSQHLQLQILKQVLELRSYEATINKTLNQMVTGDTKSGQNYTNWGATKPNHRKLGTKMVPQQYPFTSAVTEE